MQGISPFIFQNLEKYSVLGIPHPIATPTGELWCGVHHAGARCRRWVWQ